MNRAVLGGGPAREEPDQQDDSDDEEGTTSNHTSNKRSVDLLDGPFVAWNVGFVQALARVTLEQNTLVAKDARDEFVHGGLQELAAIFWTAAFGRDGAERGRTLDAFLEEVANVDGAVFTAQHAAGDAATLDVFALVLGRVSCVRGRGGPGACVEGAVEGFSLIDPDYEEPR